MDIDRSYEIFDAVMHFPEYYPLSEEELEWFNRNNQLIQDILNLMGKDWLSSFLLSRRLQSSEALMKVMYTIHKTVSGTLGWHSIYGRDINEDVMKCSLMLEDSTVSQEDKTNAYDSFFELFDEVSVLYEDSPEAKIASFYLENRNYYNNKFKADKKASSSSVLSEAEAQILFRHFSDVKASLSTAFHYDTLARMYTELCRDDSSDKIDYIKNLAVYLKGLAAMYQTQENMDEIRNL